VRAAASVCCVVVVGLVVVGGAGCSPLGLKGDSCEDSPCAAGLVCDDGVCDDPPPPPPPPCADDLECAIDGDASGRACVDGVCGFIDCAFDVQCGSRICLDGSCADAELCVADDDCGQRDGVNQLCVDDQCRPPCFGDEDCGGAVGGFSLQTCVDGRCLQRCLGDFTCLGGGLCENNACVAPDCADDSECAPGDDNGGEFCDGGRCTAFTSCDADDDCFDANLFCDTAVVPVRCAERPACRADNECGQEALCLDRHCRPAQGCFTDDDCDDADDECVGTRCVRRPDCRSSDECDGGRVCADLRCVAAPDAEAADFVVVEDRLGAIAADAARVVFVGERLTFATRGFDDDGLPVPGEIRADFTGPLAVTQGNDNVVTVDALAAGDASVTFADVGVLMFVIDPSDGLDVLVAQEAGLGVVDGATVTLGADTVVTHVFGHASFADPHPAADVVVVSFGARTVIAPRDGDNDLRVLLPSAAAAPRAAALRVTISSTGDEIGPVGVGVALPSVADVSGVSFTRLFGDVVQGQAELPVIGALPVALPSSMTLDATLPLVGEQVIRGAAEVEVAGGPAFVFALEDRREQQDLVALALAGDPTTTALDFAEQSEGMDAAVIAGGVVDERDRVADDLDRDGDGDTAERIPDYENAPLIDARPFGPPRQRSSVVARPPAGSNERALVVVGFQLPGHFLIAGTGVVRGATGFEEEPLPEPLKLIPQSATLQNVDSLVVVSGVYADDRRGSRAVARGASVPAIVDVGPLLDPPEGAFLLRDVPGDGDVSVVLPAVDAGFVKLTLSRGAELIELWSRGDGAVRLPAALLADGDDVALVEVRAYDFDDGLDPFAIGAGPVDVETAARRVAFAPPQ
jgi:hypothetical protein